jgi:hypothetical protein
MDIGRPETEREIEIAPLEEPLPDPAPIAEPGRGSSTGVSELSTEPSSVGGSGMSASASTSTGRSRSPGTT